VQRSQNIWGDASNVKICGRTHTPTCGCARAAWRAFAHFRRFAHGLIIGAALPKYFGGCTQRYNMWEHSCAHLQLRVRGAACICALSAACVRANNRCSAPKIFGRMRPMLQYIGALTRPVAAACVLRGAHLRTFGGLRTD
jgi:hypothetical protein